ncbi:MAG: secretin N-terminal domain-containing protein [Massilia sp.]
MLAWSLGALGACSAMPQGGTLEARALIEAGRLDEAITRLEPLVAAAPGNIEARVLLASARNQRANELLAQAGKDLQRQAWDEAQANYRRVAALGQIDQAMVGLAALAAARQQAQMFAEASALNEAGKLDAARTSLRALLAQYPKHREGAALLRTLAEPAPAAPPSALGKAFQKRINLQFRDAPVRAVFEAMSRASGINFTLDKDVPAELKVTVNLEGTTLELALRNVLLSVQLEQRVVDDHTILVYPNDQAKQRDYQKLSIRSFRLANAEAKAVAASLKTLLKTRDLVVDEKLNMLVLRDSPETIQMAAKLVALHDVAEPEVMLDVEILEVQRSDLESLGVKWPSSISLSPLPNLRVDPSGSITTSPFTLRDLAHLNSAGIAAAVDPMKLSASVSRDNVSVLANPRIRIKSREKALIKVGERVPSISSNVTSTGVTSQSVNYLDVGLKLEAEPVVYLDDEISIKLNLEVSSILGTIVDTNNQPYGYRIGARNAMTVLRLRDGENQVLAGLISDNDKRSASAVPGIGQLPVLDRLFGVKGTERTKTEIVLSITPHVVRNQPRVAWAEVEFDAGTDASLRGRDATPGQPQPAMQQQAPVTMTPPAPQAAPAPAAADRAGQ